VHAACAAHARVKKAHRGLWERDDGWPAIVRDGDRRVIECKDRLQWILQRRRPNGRWVDLGYFRNRDVLIARCGMTATAIEVLRALPEYHKDPGGLS
jgi:hypothetical protein